MLDTSKFKLDSAVTEIRYEPAYGLWDRAGALWHDVSRRWPGIEPAEVKPSDTRFTTKDGYEFRVDLKKAVVIGYQPASNLEAYSKDVGDFFRIVRHALVVNEITRLGLRLVFVRTFDAHSDASEFIRALTPMGRIPPTMFGINSSPSDATFGWTGEDDEFGYRINIKSEKLDVEFAPPLNMRRFIEGKTVSEPRVVFDVDYYTRKPLGFGQIKIADWVSQTLHLIRRDSKILGS